MHGGLRGIHCEHEEAKENQRASESIERVTQLLRRFEAVLLERERLECQ